MVPGPALASAVGLRLNDSVKITDQQLTDLAGERAFERGKRYFLEGRVISWTIKHKTITADVEGSECYRVELVLSSSRLEGSCDCPASEGFDFCKHCVAVALAYREDQLHLNKLADGKLEPRIEGYLYKLSKEELADELLSLILDDSELKQRWSLRADRALGKMDAKAIKKRITAALPYNRELFRYAQVRDYFAKAEPVIQMLAEQVDLLAPDQTLKLVDYALQRLVRALETVDDSGGFRFTVEETLQKLHLQLLPLQGWSSLKIAEYLSALALSNTAEIYPSIPGAYLHALSPETGSDTDPEWLQLFYQLLQARWDALPPLSKTGAIDRFSEQFSAYSRLEYLLTERAKASNDLPTLLAIMAKTAVELHDFLGIARLCMDNDAWDAAAEWLAKAKERQSSESQGQWFVEHQVERLEVRLLLAQQEIQQAVELQWRLYQATLAIQDYQQLLALAKSHKLDIDFSQKARDFLHGKLEEEKHLKKHRRFSQGGSALLEIFLLEKDLASAVALCQEQPVEDHLLLRLARQLRSRPATALSPYARLAKTYVRYGTNKSYQQAIELLQELQACLKAKTHHRAFAELLTELRREFKAKRNFIKWLKEAFGE